MNDTRIEALRSASLLEVASLIQRRELSPVEVVEAALDRAETDGPYFNTYITVMREQARDTAKAAETEILRGNYRGPLHGVPLSIKDIYWTKGVRTTSGSRVLADFIPDEDATVVARLRDAGAVLIAKANTYQFACSPPIREYGPTRNPWNVTRTTRGSSCGSAASVAAGIDYGSFGSDTGGSIRVPSAFTGIVGLKPSCGLIPRYGMNPVSWTMDFSGPMARTVGDTKALLQATIGADARDPSTIGKPDLGPGLTDPFELRGVRIGLFEEALGEPTLPEVADTVRHAARTLENAGADVTRFDMPEFLKLAGDAHGNIMWPEDLFLHRKWFPLQRDLYSQFLCERFDEAQTISAQTYLEAMELRTQLQQRIHEAMANIDILLLPVVPFPATPLEGAEDDQEEDRTEELLGLGWLNCPFDVVGNPAISVPGGLTSDNMPIGIQLVGRHFEDLYLLDVAETLEAHTGFRSHQDRLLRSIHNRREQPV